MSQPSFIPCADAAALRAALAPWLAVDPVPCALVCGLAALIADGGWCGVISVAGEPILALVQTPLRQVVLASPRPVDAAVVRLAVEQLRAPGRNVPGVNGPTPWAEAIAGAWLSVLGSTVPPAARPTRKGYRLHRLVGAPCAPTQPAGAARHFRSDEAALLQTWWHGFHEDVGEPSRPHPPAAPATPVPPSDDYLIWAVDDVPVAMARRARPLLGGWTISAVYTPPALRRRGYGGAVVTALCARLLADGASYIALYTDLANPTSNRLYARIGFQPVLDQTSITWGTP